MSKSKKLYIEFSGDWSVGHRWGEFDPGGGWIEKDPSIWVCDECNGIHLDVNGTCRCRRDTLGFRVL